MNRPRTSVLGLGAIAAVATFGPMHLLDSCGPPPKNCPTYSTPTNVHDAPTGIGFVHVQWQINPCWYADGTLTDWNVAASLNKYGSLAPVSCVNQQSPTRPAPQIEDWNFHTAMLFGVAGYGFCAVGTNFQCIANIVTPGTHQDGAMGCLVTSGNEEYLSTSNGVIKPATGNSHYWFGIAGQPQRQVTKTDYLDFQRRAGVANPGTIHSTFSGTITGSAPGGKTKGYSVTGRVA